MFHLTRHLLKSPKYKPWFYKNKTTDAIVIGGGVIGCSTALELSRKGFSVNVIDSNSNAGYGSTSYSSGICRMYYSVVDSVKFAWEGYNVWKNWPDYLQLKNIPDDYNYPYLKECGVLIPNTPNSGLFLEKTSKCLDEVNIPYSFIKSDDADKMFNHSIDFYTRYNPATLNDNNFGNPIEGESVKNVFYMKNAGFVNDPLQATINLKDAAQQNGCSFTFNKKVVRVLQKNGSVEGVKLNSGEILHSPIVINATGPESSKITKMVYEDPNCESENDMNLTTRPLRQEIAHVTVPDYFNFKNNGKIIIDFDNGMYIRPDIGNQIIIGSNEPPCDELDWVDDAGRIDSQFTDQWTAHVYRAALRMHELPIPSSTATRGIVSSYDVTEDWTPIYDKSNIGGYYMAIGTSGNQFKNVGVVGGLMAELIERNENGSFNEKMGFDYELKLTGNTINSSFFSRLRKPLDTSISVLG